MKHLIHAALIAIILLGTLSACQQTGAGPRSWIDQPLDNETFPFQALTLQAHASDEDGVKDIEFLVDDQSIKTINAGGGRMGKALYEWTPPGPGVYIIYAQAVDNNGNLGDAASSRITIVDQVAQIPLDEPEQPELNQDEEEVDPVQEAEKPAEEEPPETPPEELPPEPPPEEPPPPEPLPEDTNPPTITTVSVSPDTIYHELCDDDVRTTTLTIECIDDDLIYSGKTRVEAAWVVGNEIGSAEMPITGVHHYEITLGPFGRTGTLSIYGSCIDGSGNWTPFNITAEVKSCIE